jgi:hypothetical protein
MKCKLGFIVGVGTCELVWEDFDCPWDKVPIPKMYFCHFAYEIDETNPLYFKVIKNVFIDFEVLDEQNFIDTCEEFASKYKRTKSKLPIYDTIDYQLGNCILKTDTSKIKQTELNILKQQVFQQYLQYLRLRNE